MKPEIILAAAALAMVILLTRYFFEAWISKHRAKKEAVEQKRLEEAEAARIAALPKLDTRWLLQVPPRIMSKETIKGSYGSRYEHLLIADRDGRGWVGLAIPEVLDSLNSGEYSWYNHWIPFCGPGEMVPGKPAEVDGVKIHVYPQWMKPEEDLDSWRQWAAIERKFREVQENGWDYQQGLGDLHRAIHNRTK